LATNSWLCQTSPASPRCVIPRAVRQRRSSAPKPSRADASGVRALGRRPIPAPPLELAPGARTTGPRRRDSLSPIRQDALITGHGRKPVSGLSRRPRRCGKPPGLNAGHGDADPSSATFLQRPQRCGLNGQGGYLR
jgi:hypothetical protein